MKRFSSHFMTLTNQSLLMWRNNSITCNVTKTILLNWNLVILCSSARYTIKWGFSNSSNYFDRQRHSFLRVHACLLEIGICLLQEICTVVNCNELSHFMYIISWIFLLKRFRSLYLIAFTCKKELSFPNSVSLGYSYCAFALRPGSSFTLSLRGPWIAQY